MKTGQWMKKTMKENNPKWKCIKPIDGFEVGKVYGTDVFGWIINGVDRCTFQLDHFEKVKDE